MITEQLAEAYPDYEIEDRSVAIAALPTWVWVLALALVVIPLILYRIIGGSLSTGWLWLVWTLVLLLMHEGTHAVAWKLASGLPWSSFKFGIQWKTVTPYCHSIHPMGVQPYRIGAAMPLLLTGILPWIIGYILRDAELILASAVLISGAAGDIYILWAIRDLPDHVLLQDHDTQAGCVALWPKRG